MWNALSLRNMERISVEECEDGDLEMRDCIYDLVFRGLALDLSRVTSWME
jgi:hypothetical protein